MFLEILFEDPALFLKYVVIIILSICLHELAHGFAAIAQGDDTPQASGHMTMNPMVHMGGPSLLFLCLSGMAWGLMPVTPSKFRNKKYGDFLVAAAGPAMNLTLALLAILIFNVSIRLSWDQILSSKFVLMLAQINFSLCLFNLLPIPPLDGFRVWSTFIPSLKVLQGPFGMVLLVLLFVVPGFGDALVSCSNAMIQALVF